MKTVSVSFRLRDMTVAELETLQALIDLDRQPGAWNNVNRELQARKAEDLEDQDNE